MNTGKHKYDNKMQILKDLSDGNHKYEKIYIMKITNMKRYYTK